MPDVTSIDARLAAYRAKRDFTRTPEPYGGRVGAAFVVHRQHQPRAGFELRLEVAGALKSWSVARGPSLDPSQKRLAVAGADRPIGPEQLAGQDAQPVWDRGWWRPLVPGADPAADLAAGMLKFSVAAERMTGAWVLIRMKRRAWEGQANWLLIKERDEHARPGSGAALVEEDGADGGAATG